MVCSSDFRTQRDITANSYGVSYSYSASRYSYSIESSPTVAVRWINRGSNVVDRQTIHVKSALVVDRFTHYCPIEYEYRFTEYEYEYDLPDEPSTRFTPSPALPGTRRWPLTRLGHHIARPNGRSVCSQRPR
jgi:hypothetical protein